MSDQKFLVPNGQVPDPNPGLSRGSIPPASRFEKYHYQIKKLNPELEIIIKIQPDGLVRFTDNTGKMRIETDRGDSLDQRMVHAFQMLITLLMEEKRNNGDGKVLDARQRK